MKTSLQIFMTLAVICAWAFCPPATAQKSGVQKPNVVLIYTDDHRYTGIHALGGMQVDTPEMDKLADEGVSFTHGYLMGAFSGATCMPSRNMLMTGRNLFQIGGVGHEIPTTNKTIGEAFQAAGYHTYMIGKWHQDRAALTRSFEDGARVMGIGVYLTDHYRMPLWDWDKSGQFNKDDAYILIYDKNHHLQKRKVAPGEKRGPIGTEYDGPHSSEIFADAAVDYISHYRQKKPFFMYLAFHAPHDPRQAPKKYRDMYPPDSIRLTPSYLPQHPFDNGHYVLRDEELAPWPRTEQIAREQLAAYYAIISHLDAQIGRVIKALKEAGLYDNTIIALAGDSGLAVGNHGLMGKQNVYDEDGIHIPFIFSGGAMQYHGEKPSTFCYNYDIYPTLCNLAGIATPSSVTGKSLVPAIVQPDKQIRDFTYHAYRQHQRAYRKGDYKLIEYVRAPDYNKKTGEFIAGSRVTQLFNIQKDPWEVFNIAYFPAYKNTLKSMKEEMKAAAKEVGDRAENVKYKYDFWDYYTP